MADTLGKLKDDIVRSPAADRLKDELRSYVQARATHAISGLGGGLAKGTKALAEGKPPGQAALKAGASQLTDSFVVTVLPWRTRQTANRFTTRRRQSDRGSSFSRERTLQPAGAVAVPATTARQHHRREGGSHPYHIHGIVQPASNTRGPTCTTPGTHPNGTLDLAAMRFRELPIGTDVRPRLAVRGLGPQGADDLRFSVISDEVEPISGTGRRSG